MDGGCTEEAVDGVHAKSDFFVDCICTEEGTFCPFGMSRKPCDKTNLKYALVVMMK